MTSLCWSRGISVMCSMELKLELIDRYPLFGEVESMAILKNRSKRGQRDAVVLAFRLPPPVIFYYAHFLLLFFSCQRHYRVTATCKRSDKVPYCLATISGACFETFNFIYPRLINHLFWPNVHYWRDAKISVIEWNDETDRIRTSSLHSFENDPALRGGHEVLEATRNAGNLNEQLVAEQDVQMLQSPQLQARESVHRCLPMAQE